MTQDEAIYIRSQQLSGKPVDAAELAEALVAMQKPEPPKKLSVPVTDHDLTGLHQARYECAAVYDHLRYESRVWLMTRGVGRMDSAAWPDSGVLPS